MDAPWPVDLAAVLCIIFIVHHTTWQDVYEVAEECLPAGHSLLAYMRGNRQTGASCRAAAGKVTSVGCAHGVSGKVHMFHPTTEGSWLRQCLDCLRALLPPRCPVDAGRILP